MAHVLEKGQEAPNAAELLSARLHEDMLPLPMQVFIACAHARKIVSRVVDAEIDRPHNELNSWNDLQDCIARTLQVLESADADTVNKRAEAMVEFEVSEGKNKDIKVCDLVWDYYLPNLFFHVTTAYAILRKEGVPLGKADYEGSFMAEHN